MPWQVTRSNYFVTNLRGYREAIRGRRPSQLVVATAFEKSQKCYSLLKAISLLWLKATAFENSQWPYIWQFFTTLIWRNITLAILTKKYILKKNIYWTLLTKDIVSLNATYYRLNFNNGQSIKIKNIESVQKCIKNIYLHPCDEFTGKPFFLLKYKT